MLDEKDLQILQSMFHQNEERFQTSLTELRSELKADMVELRNEFKADMAELRNEFKAALAETESKFNTALAKTEANLRSEFKAALADTETNLRSEFKAALADTEAKFNTALAETEANLRSEFSDMLDERISQSENSVLSYIDWTREELEKKISVLDTKVTQLYQYGNLVKLEHENSETFLNIALDLQKRVTILEAKTA